MVCRTFKRDEYCNISYALTITLIITFYFLFSYQFLLYSKPPYQIPVFIIFTILSILTVWSYFTTVFTQPGRVPFYWGLYQENNLNHRKYCLLCHGFKPQRCHHCSTCKKCVLNMDHHCPWVNNCIGFHNRKFFILFLFYISLALLLISIIGVIQMIDEIKKVSKTNKTDIHFAIKLLLTLGSIPLFISLVAFLTFHLKMILSNTTTLQGMIRKRQGISQVQDYDVGNYENFIQVFGQNGFYWFIPLFGDGPKGNGINWPKNNVTNVWNSQTKTKQSKVNNKV